jgi:bifunctional non-homologous end joining protein LigD
VAATRVEVEVEGRRLSLSNLDKPMYPSVGFTKGQLIDYYTRVAPALLPHLRDRPLTLKRYPNGVDGQHFYEKRCPSHAPEWVRAEEASGINFCVCDDLSTLVWLANLADLELHPSLSLVDDILRPTVMAFDLDPGPPAGLTECCEVALILREALGHVGLECFAKTSGSKGIQVYAPLNVDEVDYDGGTKPLSKALARHLEGEHPKLIVSSQKKELRRGKVLIDWSQNDEHKTTVCVYSLRAKERPTVSTPLRWEEVDRALAEEDPDLLVFESGEVLERVDEQGDLFAPVAELPQELPEL